jgi:hypothetical protein
LEPHALVVPILFLASGALCVLRPAIAIRWAKRAHPALPEDNEVLLWIVRFIGVGHLGGATFILVKVVQAWLG